MLAGLTAVALLIVLADSETSSPAATVADPATHSVASLPSWWRLGVEVRGRADNFFDLQGQPGRGDSYYLSRIRLNSTFRIQPWLKVFIQAQDARAMDYDRRPVPCSVNDTTDIRQAYIEITAPNDKAISLRIGRQPLMFGDMRIIGTSNWGNVGATYDAVRLTHGLGKGRLDWFASTPVVPVNGIDRPQFVKRISGVYGTFAAGSTVLEPYVLWKVNTQAVGELGRPGRFDTYALGLRTTGKLEGGFDYNLEGAAERGKLNGLATSGWLAHAEVGRRLAMPKPPRIWVEYNYGSGDGNPRDGRRNGWESFTPFNTNVVGRAIDLGMRNMHEVLAGMEWQIDNKLKLRASLREMWLATTQDSLYTLSGTVLASKIGAPDRRVGTEADVWAIYQPVRRLQLWLGYGHMAPGPFLRAAGRSGLIRYPYAMWTYTVL